MAQLELYDEFDIDEFDDLDESDDYWADEGDFENDEADELALSAVLGGALGAGAGGFLTQGLYDLTSSGLQRTGNKTLSSWGKWLKDTSRARDFATNVGAGAGGVIGSAVGAVSPTGEDIDPYEPEYSAEDIDQMEALAEEAVEAEAEDAILAADELVNRSFGVMRASTRMQPIIAVLRAKVRRIVTLARRDPRYQLLARLAPLALRRTVSTLMKMAAARRPVSTRSALMIFGRILAALMRSQSGRAQAARAAQMRARRYRSRRGAPAPTRAIYPALHRANAMKSARARAIARRRAMMRR